MPKRIKNKEQDELFKKSLKPKHKDKVGDYFSKLLIFSKDLNYIAYRLGQHNIYVSRFYPLPVHRHSRSEDPSIVFVLAYSKDDLEDYLNHEDTLRIAKIFKSAYIYGKNEEGFWKGFLPSCAGSLMHLLNKGSIVRIKSKEEGIRDLCYKTFLRLNAEDNTEILFDYDDYNITFEIRKFKTLLRPKVVTYIYGKDYPNLSVGWHNQC